MVRFFFSQKACGPTRDGSCSPCVGRWSLNRWTAREVPRQRSFTFSFHLRWASFVCPFDRLSLLLCPARWLLGVACPAPRVGGVQSVLPAGAQREERPGTPSLPAGGSCPSSEVTAPGGSSSLQSRFHPWFAVTSPFPWHLSQGPGACPRPHPGVLHALGCPRPRLCGLSRTQLLCAVSCSLHCSTDPLPQTWSFSGTPVQFSSVQFSHSVVSNSLRPHRLQHARLPCPSPTPGACSNSCLLSRWCHPTISSSIVPFSSLLPLSIFPRIRVFSGTPSGLKRGRRMLAVPGWRMQSLHDAAQGCKPHDTLELSVLSDVGPYLSIPLKCTTAMRRALCHHRFSIKLKAR